MLTGVQMVHVPYRGGGPALADLVGGQVQVMFGSMPSMIGYVRAGTLRPLAVTTAVRSDVLPDTPTIGEFVTGYEATDFYGLGAPKDTPADIVGKLNGEVNAWLADPAPRRGSPISAAWRRPARRPNSAARSPPKPRNGPR